MTGSALEASIAVLSGANVHVFNENHLQPIRLDSWLTLWGAAHTGPAKTNGFLSSFRVDSEGVNLAVFHGSERGSEQGEGKILHSPFDAEQIEQASVFLGHYTEGRPALHLPGQPRHSEGGERGIVIASVSDDGRVERERVSVAITEVHDLDVDITGCASQQDVRGRVEERIMGRSGVARLNLSGELFPDVDLRLNDLQPLAGNSDLVLTIRIGDIHSGYDFEAIRNEPTVRGKFVTNVMAANMSEDERRKVLITGLRAMEEREDLEVV